VRAVVDGIQVDALVCEKGYQPVIHLVQLGFGEFASGHTALIGDDYQTCLVNYSLKCLADTGEQANVVWGRNVLSVFYENPVPIEKKRP